MKQKILCPICEQVLGFSIEEIKEKCPVCDTWKFEILKALEEQGKEGDDTHKTNGAVAVVGYASPKEEIQTEGTQTQVVIEEEVTTREEKSVSSTHPDSENADTDAIIFSDHDQINEDVIFDEGIPSVPSLRFDTKARPPAPAGNGEVAIISPTTSKVDTGSKPTRTSDEIPKEDRETISKEDHETATSKPTFITTEDVVFDIPITETSEHKVDIPQPSPKKSTKSGASSLEILPEGFKYCPTCGKGYLLHSPEDQCVDCQEHPALMVESKGFPPGRYLILYNVENKAIAYFWLDLAGSIILGRSSERNAPHDIDISLAWKWHYQNCTNAPEQFQEKMKFLKGISRKHALVRYIPSEKKCVLFHLSDKNYTIVKLPDGVKRVREPQNRAQVDIPHGSVVSMGNQQEYIFFRYKVVPNLHKATGGK